MTPTPICILAILKNVLLYYFTRNFQLQSRFSSSVAGVVGDRHFKNNYYCSLAPSIMGNANATATSGDVKFFS